MLVNDVLSSLLQEKIHFSSDNFVWDYRTREFSNFDLKLCGLWLLISTDCYSDASRILSLMSPRITKLSVNGGLMLYAWPFNEDCWVKDYTDENEE